jgi:hypothetical protein
LRKPTTGIAARWVLWDLLPISIAIAHLSGQKKETAREIADEEAAKGRGAKPPDCLECQYGHYFGRHLSVDEMSVLLDAAELGSERSVLATRNPVKAH